MEGMESGSPVQVAFQASRFPLTAAGEPFWGLCEDEMTLTLIWTHPESKRIARFCETALSTKCDAGSGLQVLPVILFEQL
jgi:hypothetical protein